ncbi:glutathione S-transferase [Acetobacter cibinongensis]|uniref:Glutathione S-transferase n=1 Tax=Acetobacter cibinongensis TaxID=146475 RepID=A0A0D6N7K6_9PROT|nr:glutathione S-transferase [Acetobacter cibinongensis]GAN61675.1 glutathione S-transferase [Acetobacter cibinongensis]GBQ19386.1 glutathione S-transferase [Acetobacter cibinongensis NRIC 0482]GEL59853.1 glutathione S-transferase [Acetobacter cibinongensis]
MTDLPILYSFRRCPYAMRARLALLASQTDCEIREVKLAQKPPEMLALSPKGTVPVLVQPDGMVMEESLDIMLAALRHNDPLGWLSHYNSDLVLKNDTHFKFHLDRYKYSTRYNTDALEHRAKALGILNELERLFDPAFPFLDGQAMSLMDAALAPFVRQFAATDTAWFDAQRLPAIQRWLMAFTGSRLFERAMIRLPVWQAGDCPVFLT